MRCANGACKEIADKSVDRDVLLCADLHRVKSSKRCRPSTGRGSPSLSSGGGTRLASVSPAYLS